jgi:primosomal protein N'
MSDNKKAVSGAPSECRFRLASVYILGVPFHLDKLFDYLLDQNTDAKEGDLVAVPFGGGNRPQTALVYKVTPLENYDELQKYKPVSHVLSSALSLSGEALSLVAFLKERTFCSTGEAVKTITPTSAFSSLLGMLIPTR